MNLVASETSRILVVDDDPNIRQALARSLRRDAEVLLAVDGVQALRILQSNDAVDVIICDQSMPGISGVEVLRRIASQHPSIKRVMMTGHVDSQTVVDSVNVGHIDHFAGKPWQPSELRNIILELAAQARMERKAAENANRLRVQGTQTARELMGAGAVQRAFTTPCGSRFVANCWTALEVRSHEDVGGDFQLIREAVDGRLEVVIGDVMGKGVRAGIAASYLIAALQESAHELGLRGAWRNLRQKMDGRLADLGMLVTLLWLRFDRHTGMLEYVDCGAPKALVLPEDGRAAFQLHGNDLPLGVLARSAEDSVGFAKLEPGDQVVAYTDGLVELGTAERMIDLGNLLPRPYPGSPGNTLRSLLTQVEAFGEVRDDLSLLVFQAPTVDCFRESFIPALSELSKLRAFVAESVAALGFTNLDGPVLVANEVLANLARHAVWSGAAKRFVDVSLFRSDVGFEMVVADYSEPFDLRNASVPEAPNPRIGGYGILLIRAQAGKIDYQPAKIAGERNILTLTFEEAT